jgi:formylglycine-generating enzyme required for sulfatase activity
MPEQVRVFVSYASPDRAFAERLVNDLKAAGAEVWWDVSGIDEGDFLGKINQALQQCQWIVLVLTPNAVASKWVNIEVNAGINRREQGLMRGVLPVLASTVGHDGIPPIWDNLHRYDGVGNYQGEIARLARTLGLSGAAAELPQAAPAIPVGPPDYIPQGLWDLGYRGMHFPSDGAGLIVPPVCDVPAGSFPMGSDTRADPQANDDELPQHSLTLPAFQISKYPVTVAEYACFVRAGQQEPSDWLQQLGKLDHPVVYVSWHDAVAYARWLVAHTGQLWRLPSEAEWEKATRGTDGRIYPWGDTWDPAKANTGDGGKRGTTPVGSYPAGASPCGAQELAGNVCEWTSSLAKPYPYNASDGREQVESSGNRVLRGGSWSVDARLARAAYRSYVVPGNHLVVGIGFRLAGAAAGS